MKYLINDLKSKYLSLWFESRTDFPKFEKKISYKNRITDEKNISKFINNLIFELHQIPDSQNDINKWSLSIFSLIKKFEFSITGSKSSMLDFFIDKGYQNVTEMFIKEVRQFDSKIDITDIFQAMRNVWIMNSVQIMFNMKVRLTPSIFSYSMLYPYSDNYLDDINVSGDNKKEFNDKFRKWLSGEITEPSSQREKYILKLINKIEEEFVRAEYGGVFDSLLSIHTAQEESLKQQRINSLPYEKDIIGITFEKGGTSVLADGYLVKGNLSKQEADFMFGYGVFLQIIDDLQDVEEDLKNGHITMFSQIANKWTLDKLSNKLFSFIENILNRQTILLSDDSVKLKKVILESCNIMILEAISKNKKMFSRKYIKQIEEYSMIRLKFYKKVKKKINKNFSSEDINNLVLAMNYANKVNN